MTDEKELNETATPEANAAEATGEAEQPDPGDVPPTEYDAAAKQRAGFQIPLGDEIVDVVLTFDPNRQPADVLWNEYVNRSKKVIEADQPALSDLQVANESASVAGAVYMFDALTESLAGIDGLPDDWRSIFSPKEKHNILALSWLYAFVLPPITRREGRPIWGEQFRHSTIRMSCFFDGRKIETVHVLRKPDAKLLREYNAAWTRALDEYATDAAIIHAAPFYEKMRVESRHYKNGVVPLHHQGLAVVAHMRRQSEIARKN